MWAEMHQQNLDLGNSWGSTVSRARGTTHLPLFNYVTLLCHQRAGLNPSWTRSKTSIQAWKSLRVARHHFELLQYRSKMQRLWQPSNLYASSTLSAQICQPERHNLQTASRSLLPTLLWSHSDWKLDCRGALGSPDSDASKSSCTWTPRKHRTLTKKGLFLVRHMPLSISKLWIWWQCSAHGPRPHFVKRLWYQISSLGNGLGAGFLQPQMCEP